MDSRQIPSPGVNGSTTDTIAAERIQSTVEEVLQSTPLIDMHTHLFPAAFGKLAQWGIDRLLTYHYLEAEFFRSSDFTPDRYWSLSMKDRADAIWQALFVENTPLSEATRGVVAILDAFDLSTTSSDLSEARAFFAAQAAGVHIRKVLAFAGVSTVVMTNDPLDPDEATTWMNGVSADPQFQAVLRLDRIVRGWPENWQVLRSQGYDVDDQVSGRSVAEIRRFISDWCNRTKSVAM